MWCHSREEVNLGPTHYHLTLNNSIEVFSLTNEKGVSNKIDFVITRNMLCKRKQIITLAHSFAYCHEIGFSECTEIL